MHQFPGLDLPYAQPRGSTHGHQGRPTRQCHTSVPGFRAHPVGVERGRLVGQRLVDELPAVVVPRRELIP